MAQYFVSVTPGINRVPLGETATFECMVNGDVQVQQYSWVGSEKIAKEERFSYGSEKRILHVNNLKAYDNNTWVDCTAMAGGREMKASGRIVVLSSRKGWVTDNMMPSNMMPMGNETMADMDKLNDGEIPSLSAGGGVVIALGFILVIVAMFGALKWLKNMEIRKMEDLENARNMYSTIEVGPTGRARYNRDQGNVHLGGHAYGDEEEGEDDDSYEDMLPTMPKRLPTPGESSTRGSGPSGVLPIAPPRTDRGSGSSGQRYQPPPRGYQM